MSLPMTDKYMRQICTFAESVSATLKELTEFAKLLPRPANDLHVSHRTLFAAPKNNRYGQAFSPHDWEVAYAAVVDGFSSLIAFTFTMEGEPIEWRWDCECNPRGRCSHVQSLGHLAILSEPGSFPCHGITLSPSITADRALECQKHSPDLTDTSIRSLIQSYGLAQTSGQPRRLAIVLRALSSGVNASPVFIRSSAKATRAKRAKFDYDLAPSLPERIFDAVAEGEEEISLLVSTLLRALPSLGPTGGFTQPIDQIAFKRLLSAGRVLDKDGYAFTLKSASPAIEWRPIGPDRQKAFRAHPPGLLWVLPDAGIALSDDGRALLDLGAPRSLIERVVALPPLQLANVDAVEKLWRDTPELARLPAPTRADLLPIRDVRVALRAKIDASNSAPFAASVTLSFASEDGTALPPDVTPQALVKGEGEWIRYLVDPSALDRASRILRNEGLDSESRNPLAFRRASHYNYRRGVPESVSIALHLLPVAASFDAKGKPISFVANGQPVVPELALSLARLPDRNKPIPVDVNCVIGGVKVDPFILDRAARHAYDHHSNLAFQLPDDGPWSVISFEALSRWVASASPIIRCLTVSGTKITINRRDAIGLAAARFDLPGPGGEELQKIIAGSLAAKLAFGPETVPCVDGVTFLPYQTQAASWLSYLRENSLSGLLADDRGMGKTLEVLSAIATRRNEIVDAGLEIERPIALIVVERKEIAHWATAHGDRYCKKLGIHLEHGPTQLRLVSELKRKAVILTTYNQVVRDPDRFHALAPEFVFFDEAKAMKNTSSKRWSCARDFKSSTLVPITGTPLDRNVGDIWSLFELACPGVLGDQSGFKALWSSLIGRRDEQAMSALRTIREKIAPFSLRRTKSDVRDQFKSEKRQSVEWLTLDDAEAKSYESIRARAEADKDTIFEQLPFHKAQIKVQGVIERVRRHVAKPGRPGELTTKGEHLVSMVSDLIEAEHKVLVFSSFNDHCETISEIFNSSGIANAVYSGGNAKKRDRELSFFKDGHVPVLILSDLGSSGLDLPEADTVIIYDPWINLGKEDQKGDRAHRLVSSKDVSVFSLVTAGTIEAAGHAVLERSRSSGEAFFSDTAEGVESVALTIDDYDAMFASPRG